MHELHSALKRSFSITKAQNEGAEPPKKGVSFFFICDKIVGLVIWDEKLIKITGTVVFNDN